MPKVKIKKPSGKTVTINKPYKKKVKIKKANGDVLTIKKKSTKTVVKKKSKPSKK